MWFKVTFLNVPAGSGWRKVSHVEGSCEDAFRRMIDMVKEGGDDADPPSGVLIEGHGCKQLYDWADAKSAEYLLG